MENKKEQIKKWGYWFLLGVALIVIYKCLDNFTDVTGVIGNFLSVIAPFFVGIFIAYLLYMPCRKLETFFRKRKIKIFKRKARTFSIITVYFIVLLVIVILFSFILPVVWDSV